MRNTPRREPNNSRQIHPEAPRITSVKVGGFKAVTQVKDIRIGELTIIAGANSSGKSSAMQPILLLKQSIEAARGGTDLALSGDHVKFTDKKQIQSRQCVYGNEVPCDLTIGLTVDFTDSMYQTYGATNGKPLSITSAHYCLPHWGSNDFALKAGMTATEVQAALRNFLPIISPDFEPVDYRARVERGLLSVSLDLSRKKTTDQEAEQRPLFGVEVPFGDTFTSAVSSIIHVQGVRGVPRQSQFVPRRGDLVSGAMDLYVASLLLEWNYQKNAKLVLLREHLFRLGLTSGIQADQINDSIVEVSVARSMSHPSEMVSIADVGFGVSQVLPVLLALVAAEPNQLVYIEQPEVHLHPNAQVILAQIICEAVARKVRVVVETHSELMLLSIQTAVANGLLEGSSVEMHWFSRDVETGATTISSGTLPDDGSLGAWPADFSSVTLDAQLAYLHSVNALVGPSQ